MRRILIVLTGLVALLLLAFMCAHHHRAAIEADLTTRAEKQLLDAGLGNINVSAEGRDMRLAGTVGNNTEKERGLDLAKVHGVRVVKDSLQLADSGTSTASAATDSLASQAIEPAAASEDWRLSAKRNPDGVLVWEGSIDAEGRDSVVAAARQWFGDGTQSTIQADATSRPSAGALNAIRASFPFLDTVADGALEATPGRLILSGRPASIEEAQTVWSSVAAAMPPGMVLEPRWDRQWLPEELYLEAASRGSNWSLAGLVPSGDRERWLTEARAAGLEPLLEDRLLEADVEAPEGFGKGFSAALSNLDQLNGVRVVESNRGLEISGLSDDPDAADRLRSALAEKLPGLGVEVAVERQLDRNECQQDIVQALASEKIRFDSGSARVGSASDSLLRRLAATLKRCPSSKVRVDGHTDSDGAEEFNQRLSMRRADAVVRRMVKFGVTPSRLTSRGFGETKPLSGGDSSAAQSPEDKRLNRRIEFQLQEGE